MIKKIWDGFLWGLFWILISIMLVFIAAALGMLWMYETGAMVIATAIIIYALIVALKDQKLAP
jgi:hypothetical protein